MDILEWVEQKLKPHRGATIILTILLAFVTLLGVIGDLQTVRDLPSLPWRAIALIPLLVLLAYLLSVTQDRQGYYTYRGRLIARFLVVTVVLMMAILAWAQLHLWLIFSYRQWEIANYSLLFLLIFGLVWFTWVSLKDSRTPPTLIILVCEFSEGARKEVPSDRTVTQKVLEHLRDKARLERVQIVHHEDVIIEHNDAMLLGQNARAAAVLFGYYTKYQNSVVLNLHFQVIRQPSFELKIKDSQRTMPFEDLDRGELQLFLGRDYTSVVLFFVGLFEYSDENYSEALSYFQRALDEVEKQSAQKYSLPVETVYLYIGNSLVYQGQYAAGEDSFQNALIHRPGFGKALHNLGVIHYGQNNFEQALDDFSEALNADPELSLAHRNRAFANAALGDYAEAANEIELYLSEESDDIEAIQLFAYCLGQQGNIEQSAEKYGTILAIDPTYHVARIEMARAYFKAGKDEMAIELFDRLASTNKQFAIQANVEIASYYERKGDCEQALEYYSKALDNTAKNPNVLMDRGLVHYRCGNFEAAESDLTQILDIDPDHPKAIFYRGKSRFELRKYKEALSDFDKFLELAPKHEKHLGYAARAMISMRQKSYCKATLDFEEARRHLDDPARYDNPLAKAHFACAHELVKNEASVDELVPHLQQVKLLNRDVWEMTLALDNEKFQLAITQTLLTAE